VQNEGEDSFETTFDMSVPPGVNYVKIERTDDVDNDIPVQCSAPSAMTNNILHCDIGNPLPRDKYVSRVVGVVELSKLIVNYAILGLVQSRFGTVPDYGNQG